MYTIISSARLAVKYTDYEYRHCNSSSWYLNVRRTTHTLLKNTEGIFTSKLSICPDIIWISFWGIFWIVWFLIILPRTNEVDVHVFSALEHPCHISSRQHYCRKRVFMFALLLINYSSLTNRLVQRLFRTGRISWM